MVCVLGEAYLCVYVCKSGKIAFGTLTNVDFPYSFQCSALERRI